MSLGSLFIGMVNRYSKRARHSLRVSHDDIVCEKMRIYNTLRKSFPFHTRMDLLSCLPCKSAASTRYVRLSQDIFGFFNLTSRPFHYYFIDTLFAVYLSLGAENITALSAVPSISLSPPLLCFRMIKAEFSTQIEIKIHIFLFCDLLFFFCLELASFVWPLWWFFFPIFPDFPPHLRRSHFPAGCHSPETDNTKEEELFSRSLFSSLFSLCPRQKSCLKLFDIRSMKTKTKKKKETLSSRIRRRTADFLFSTAASFNRSAGKC